MKYAIFGAGKLGERFYQNANNKYDVDCFVDNDVNKQGTKLFSKHIIAPNELLKHGLSVIIASIYHVEIVKQLFDMGIKEFFVLKDYNGNQLRHISMAAYDNLSEVSNRICIYRKRNSCSISTALINNNTFADIEVVAVDHDSKDGEHYYNYWTSKLIITQFGERTAGGKLSIELWHGFTIKTLFLMDNNRKSISYTNNILRNLNNKTAICSLSKLYSILFGYCCNINIDKFHVTGYPRNDMLYNSNGIEHIKRIFTQVEQKYIIIYMPTYRESDYFDMTDGENNFLNSMPGYDESDFIHYLEDNDILLIYKMHTTQPENKLFPECCNIRELTDKILYEYNIDLYEMLNATDCLISDYSSVIIDYLLTDKPIILTPTDLDSYSGTRGLMLEPYDAWMPGEIALNYESLKTAISNALFGQDKFKKDREWMKRIAHKYTDGNSTKRVLSLARELLEIQ